MPPQYSDVPPEKSVPLTSSMHTEFLCSQWLALAAGLLSMCCTKFSHSFSYTDSTERPQKKKARTDFCPNIPFMGQLGPSKITFLIIAFRVLML